MDNENRKNNYRKSSLPNVNGGFNNVNSEDAQRLRESMGKNSYAPKYGERYRSESEDEDESSQSRQRPSLEDKEGLDKQNGLDNKEGLGSKEGLGNTDQLKDKNDDKKSEKSSGGFKDKIKNVAEEKSGIAKLKKKFLKLKITIKILIISLILFLGAFIIFIVFAYLLLAIDNFFTGITNFFGIAEGSETDIGLYNDERYYYDEDGNDLSAEDLVNSLKEDSTCSKVTKWSSFLDAVSRFFHAGRITSECELIRYIKSHTSPGGSNDLKVEVDKGLIIGTIFYGFDSQTPIRDDDKNETSPSEHYETLKNILEDNSNIITTDTIDQIIDNAVITKEYKYYTWQIVTDNDDDEEDETKKHKTKTGYCVRTDVPYYRYSLEKWKVFMRFGEAVAKEYEQVGVDAFMYNSTSEECRGEKTIEELREQIGSENGEYEVIIDSSVPEAISAVEPKKNAPSYVGGFDQKADVDSDTKDNFSSVNGLALDYIYGFAYQRFPAFKEDYDDIYTAKQIETLITEIIDRKVELNNVLLLDDLDSSGDSSVISTTGVIGAYCKDYLTAAYDDITVQVTDCDGNLFDNVSFEDYIIGVANLEVSNTHDDYVMAEMLAAITYAFHRHENYTKGTIITMKSGNCDQAYCNMKKGCYAKQANLDCGGFKCTSYITGGNTGLNPGLYSKYQELYRKAAEYLVVRDNKVFPMHYTSTNQNRWAQKAKSGMAFTQIIQEEYQDEGAQVIKCTEKSTSDTTTGSASSAKPTGEYDSVAPNLGKFSGFAYKKLDGRNIEIEPTWKSNNLIKYTVSCPGTSFNGRSFTINKLAESNFDSALKSMCKMIQSGVRLSDGTLCKYTANDFSRGEVQVSKRISATNDKVSLHAYGLAQDWNYDKYITVNGKQYHPYGTERQESLYREFVNALGKEESCLNVNYILWKYAYEPAGFKWGGNWSGSSFDGMHYEVAY